MNHLALPDLAAALGFERRSFVVPAPWLVATLIFWIVLYRLQIFGLAKRPSRIQDLNMNWLQLILAQLTHVEIVVTERKNSRQIRIKGIVPRKARSGDGLN